METTLERDADWAAIEAKLPSNWRALAEAHKIIKTTGRGAKGKIRDSAVVLRIILHHVCSGAALKTTVGLAAAIFVTTISAPALHGWMCRAGGWIADLVAAMVGRAAAFAPARWAGDDVIAVDATTVQRPGALGITSRVHYALRLFDLRAVAIHVTDVTVGETLRNFAMGARQLWVADRGYGNANSIAHAAAAQAAVLIRFAFGSLPLFNAAGRALDVRALVQRVTKAGRCREWAVWIHPKGRDRIAARLVVMRLDTDQTAQARARLRREHKATDITPEMDALAAYVVLVTTVPRATLATHVIIELYRLRWQVELDFKREKSIGELDALPNRKPETIHTWICAKLLGLALARRLAEPSEPFPPSVVGHYVLRPRLAHLGALAARLRA